jgi:hypothetical protein
MDAIVPRLRMTQLASDFSTAETTRATRDGRC